MRKIDGRKAEITSPSERYQTYRGFAEKHGYPDAAAKDHRLDRRKRLSEGDIVTLLVSGEHGDTGAILWIVEAANGERHIFNEKGLRILSEELSGVIVLKDESLGGIEREYREVKRKAAVGERVKITADKSAMLGQDFEGSVFTVTYEDCVEVYTDGKWADGSTLNPAHDDYVVLEPSEIIRIDSERHRMVDRKAAVGERVIITDWLADKHVDGSAYKNGDVATTINDKIFVQIPHNDRIGYVALLESEYRVLEPVASTKSAEPTATLSAQPPIDQAAANISALTAKVQALESRVSALEKANQPVKVVEGPADDAPPSFAIPRKSGKSFVYRYSPKSPQQLRDEMGCKPLDRDAVVERAKADVAELTRIGDTQSENLPMTSPLWDDFYRVEFVVNRDKRTVVALVRPKHTGEFDLTTGTFRVIKGIAKCAPNDVFNAHIGGAIALRRALGLEVPSEYLNVPNPEEPRVGDVVDEIGGMNRKGRVVREIRPRGFGLADEGLTFEGYGWAFIRDCKIIDDSREEVGAE